MSHVALNSSTALTAYSNHSTFLQVAHATSTDQFGSTSSLKFQPITKPAGYVFGELVVAPLLTGAAKIASYVYFKLPSFSLPVASASTTPECTPSICPTPTGSYNLSCHKTTVRYFPDEDKCEVNSLCEKEYEGLPHQRASFSFSPREPRVALENRNGSLAVESASSDDRLSTFGRIAEKTGGIVALAPFKEDLKPQIEKTSEHILQSAGSNKLIDIAFVVDTTASMGPYVEELQNNLVQFVQYLQAKTRNNGNTIRVALIEYRDRGAQFLNRVNTGFTSNLDQIKTAVRGLTVEGGGDEPEAVLDALQAAQSQLSWNSEAHRAVILIGDAPPHPRTADGLLDEAAVIAQYRAANTQVAVYPVFAGRG